MANNQQRAMIILQRQALLAENQLYIIYNWDDAQIKITQAFKNIHRLIHQTTTTTDAWMVWNQNFPNEKIHSIQHVILFERRHAQLTPFTQNEQIRFIYWEDFLVLSLHWRALFHAMIPLCITITLPFNLPRSIPSIMLEEKRRYNKKLPIVRCRPHNCVIFLLTQETIPFGHSFSQHELLVCDFEELIS